MQQASLEVAIDHQTESSSVEYKASFDSSSTGEWAEIIKDVVAMANSGGGVIIFGLNDDGTASDFDCGALESLDPAHLTDKVFKYTGQQFHSFAFHKTRKKDRVLFAIVIAGVPVPIVFSKPGVYTDPATSKPKTAFSVGTVYFRHGAKSEPGNSDDLRIVIEDRIEQMRKAWFEGIVKVVEAPPGSEIHVGPPQGMEMTAGPVHLVNDPAAPAFRQISVDETHPHRQKEVVAAVTERMNGAVALNSYHIQCVRQAYGTDANPTFTYTMSHSSPRYSDAFVDWIAEEWEKNPDFVEEAKRRVKEKKG